MRSNYCGDISESDVGSVVWLCGWVHTRRDHGGVIFIDLRDIKGKIQIVFDPSMSEIFAVPLASYIVLMPLSFIDSANFKTFL